MGLKGVVGLGGDKSSWGTGIDDYIRGDGGGLWSGRGGTDD